MVIKVGSIPTRPTIHRPPSGPQSWNRGGGHGTLVEWLRRYPVKVEITGSTPVRVAGAAGYLDASQPCWFVSHDRNGQHEEPNITCSQGCCFLQQALAHAPIVYG